MRARHPLLREAVLSAFAAALVAAVLAWLGPPGTDLAAHAYQRTLYLQHGFVLWNNFWYAGRYSFVTYSVLYYPLAALLGIRLLAVATIALAALAFAVVLGREWGPSARWSSRTFAVVWAGIVLSAAFPFALGTALALLALWAMQSGARWRFAALATLTLAASPVAFVLLVVVVVGIALANRATLPRNWVQASALVLAGLVELVLWRLFPGGGHYPFSLAEAAAAVVFCVLGLVFTWRVESGRVLRFVFGVYLVGVRRLVPRPVRARRERGALPLRGDPARGARLLAAPLAAAAVRSRRPRPRRRLERGAARRELPERARGRDREQRRLAGRDRVPARASRPRLPRGGGRHGRALARGVSRGRAHPARARLVPAGRLPAERGALLAARTAGVPALAPLARDRLRRPLGRAAGLQLTGRGGARPQRPRRAATRLPHARR